MPTDLRHPPLRPSRLSRRALRAVAVLLAVAILLVDVLTPLEGAVAVLYVVVVLIAAQTGRRGDILIAAGVSLGFTLLAYLASHGLAHVGSPSLRALVSLAAIAITAALSLANRAATEQLAATAGLVDISHDMIFMRDMAGAITFRNRAAEQVYGWTQAEAVGQSADALLATRYPQPRAAIDAALAATGRWEGRLVHRTRAGADIVVDSRWALHADRFGQPVGVLETNTDVSAREAAHAALVQSERRYRRMFEGSRVGVVEEDWTPVRAVLGEVRDAAGLAAAIAADPGLVGRARRAARIVGVNPAFRAMLGVADTGALTVDDVLGDDDTSFVGVLAAFVGGARSLEGDAEVTRADGTRLPVMFGIHFPGDGEGDAGVFVFVVDLSDRKAAQDALLAAQAELAHAARVATLGEISASIAHEVNQPLMAVVTNGEAALRWLKRPQPDLAEVEAGLSRIVAEGRRASRIVAGIRGFARKAPPARETLEPAELVDEALRLVARETARAGVHVAVAADPALPAITVDRVAIQQVLVNLLLNAVQALAATDGPRRIRVAAERTGDGVVLSVADTGPGLAGTDADRLFQPFYTTRPTGLGLGLAIARSTAEAHGGRLTAGAAPGGGALFRLTLPVPAREDAA